MKLFSLGVASTLIGYASAAAISPRALINLNLPVNVGARVLVGDPTCPPLPDANGVNARVFAVVDLKEEVKVSGNVLNLANANVDVTADALVCLCVEAGVNVANIVPPTYLNGEVLADLTQLSTGVGFSLLNPNPLGALNALLGSGVNADVSLTPLSIQQTCGNCPPNQYPGCVNGACTCTSCPAGQFYSASQGKCITSASPVARSRLRARDATEARLAHRQATRDQVRKRLDKKNASLATPVQVTDEDDEDLE